MASIIPLAEIPTLTLLYKLDKIPSPSNAADPTSPSPSAAYNDKISLIRTDITKLATDAIVNAANESLLGGGGVDGAIHRAAGPALLDECRTLDGCDTGDAKVTQAYNLSCKNIIHAVGPVYSSRNWERSEKMLKSCYTKSLTLATQNDCRSIAFSALSTGVYGYPSDEAAEAAIGAVRDWLDEDKERANKLDRIVFCSFMAKDEAAYENIISEFFPPIPSVHIKDKADEGAKETPPVLPDVPTKQPAQDGEPDLKKQKVSDDVKE
ncbi:ADP-ribose glycohydrolase MACROD1 [Acrodontium crateriforme]|uniref:ADP-ribose glycohydrolase MACROD1 n=1 Tax=Acrodontium crateriforme TaxID=150365 RepID=A0AAQ3M185_9PEZI|nr:ADP-ribose glycohydrolase MACROD1 [Acrodontium crateriforme]